MKKILLLSLICLCLAGCTKQKQTEVPQENISVEKEIEIGQTYTLDSYEVIKIDKTFVSKENMKVRASPEFDAEECIAEYQWPYCYRNYGNYLPLNSEINLMLKGYYCPADAETLKKDTVDGIEAPWYRVYIGGGEESIPMPYWVWGGYCVDASGLTQEEDEYYSALFEEEALKKELIMLNDEEE